MCLSSKFWKSSSTSGEITLVTKCGRAGGVNRRLTDRADGPSWRPARREEINHQWVAAVLALKWGAIRR